jgi:hypothetical protein
MATNQFFTHGNFGEQRLVQDLINEQLRMYGIDVYYLPRVFLNTDTIVKENIVNKFTDNFIIEAYVNTYSGFGKNTDMLGKFGIQVTDTLSLIISREKFEDFIAPIMETSIEDYKLSARPKEGDLIYFPLNDTVYEIKFIEHEVDFYQLNKLYTYEISCEPFMFEDELIDTSIEDVDNNFVDRGYNTILTLSGAGVTAGAATSITNGSVSKIYLVNDGYGYTSTPTVAISSAPIGGRTATAVAIMTSYPGASGVYAIDRILIKNSGGGYVTPPTISFVGGGGSGAIATAGISSGAISGIAITNFGQYYSTNPTITISSPSGAGTTATVEAVIGAGGTITQVYITNAGSGYTSIPTIVFSNPGISTGNYALNEIVIGTSSSTTSVVKEWDYDTRILKVYRSTGRFQIGETIIGTANTITNVGLGRTGDYRIMSINYYGDAEDDFRQNVQIENAGLDILDFSEKNPFGNY